MNKTCYLKIKLLLHPRIIPYLPEKISFSIPHLKITCITTSKLFIRLGLLLYNRYGTEIFRLEVFMG